MQIQYKLIMTPPIQSLPKSGLLFMPEGVVRYSTTFEYLGEQNDIIKQAATQVPYDARNIAQSIHGNPIHIQFLGVGIVAYTRLPGVLFNTFWGLYDEGRKMYPRWPARAAGPADASDIPAKLRWMPPANMATWYITSYIPEHSEPGRAKFAGAFLVAVRKEDAKYYRLPTGNVNDAGNICMGPAFSSNERAPLVDRVNDELKQFDATEWNSDLNRDEPSTPKALFTFNSNGQEQAPYPGDWTQFCRVISARTYASLPLTKLSF